MGSLVMACFSVAAAGWLLGVVEMIAVAIFAPLAFRLGCVGARVEDFTAAPVLLPPGFIGETALAKFKMTDNAKCLFRRKFAFLNRRVLGPFEMKGTLEWGTGHFVATGRLPVGSMMFLVGWFGFFGVFMATLAALPVLPPVLFGVVLVIVSLRSARRNFVDYVQQVSEAVTGQPQPTTTSLTPP